MASVRHALGFSPGEFRSPRRASALMTTGTAATTAFVHRPQFHALLVFAISGDPPLRFLAGGARLRLRWRTSEPMVRAHIVILRVTDVPERLECLAVLPLMTPRHHHGTLRSACLRVPRILPLLCLLRICRHR